MMRLSYNSKGDLSTSTLGNLPDSRSPKRLPESRLTFDNFLQKNLCLSCKGSQKFYAMLPENFWGKTCYPRNAKVWTYFIDSFVDISKSTEKVTVMVAPHALWNLRMKNRLGRTLEPIAIAAWRYFNLWMCHMRQQKP